MANLISLSAAEPQWQVAIQRREAMLWLGPRIAALAPDGDVPSLLDKLLTRPWAAVYIDASGLPIREVVDRHRTVGNLVVRLYDRDEGPDQILSNRLPIFLLTGADGSTKGAGVANPLGMLARFKKLEKAPAGIEVFALGVDGATSFASVREAIQIGQPHDRFRKWLFATPTDTDLAALAAEVDRVVYWPASITDFVSVLPAPIEARDDYRLLARSSDGQKLSVNLAGCDEPSNPITTSFELIPERETLSEPTPTESDLKAFLADATAGWRAYAARIPYPRQRLFSDSLRRSLKKFRHERWGASRTLWLPAEDGSGATTVLRLLCFEAAREGYPVLVARPKGDSFDFKQLQYFLAKSAERYREVLGEGADGLPWVIAFDAEHTELHWPFVSGLCNGLMNQQRPVVILAVRPVSGGASESEDAHGVNRDLSDAPLSNSVSVDEAERIGAHLCDRIPSLRRRGKEDWRGFIGSTARPGSEGGRRGLFWLALRYWLFPVPGSDIPLREWLAGKVTEWAAGRSYAYAGLLEVAALARYRLSLPLSLLPADSQHALRSLATDASNIYGLHLVHTPLGSSVGFAHPLVAEELMRIALGSAAALSAVDVKACTGLLDLELYLLGRLIARPEAGSREGVRVLESLATNALRVDPFESPRNYQVRDRIVAMLDRTPDSVWDTSQVFNHHVAKARRHLADKPPNDAKWTLAARRAELDKAERHLTDALYEIHPEEEDRRESELHLLVSLALTYTVRSQLEAEAGGDPAASEQYQRQADEAYRNAQARDGDNLYALENFARFKIRRARTEVDERTRIRLVVEAISLLEQEQAADQREKRIQQTTDELASAYEMLTENNGLIRLTLLSQQGSEPAFVALAKLAVRKAGSGPYADIGLSEAEQLLAKVQSKDVTWRSRDLLYHIVGRRSPRDFARRLELLRELAADPEYVWPMQRRLEYAILLFQVGDPVNRAEGRQVFAKFREDLPDRSGPVGVPAEMKYLMDPMGGYAKPLQTVLIVKRDAAAGSRTMYGVPDGWMNVDVAFRPSLFPKDTIRFGDELDCFIQFTHFGPLAIPLTSLPVPE